MNERFKEKQPNTKTFVAHSSYLAASRTKTQTKQAKSWAVVKNDHPLSVLVKKERRKKWDGR